MFFWISISMHKEQSQRFLGSLLDSEERGNHSTRTVPAHGPTERVALVVTPSLLSTRKAKQQNRHQN